MKRSMSVAMAVILGVSIFGCSKKEPGIDEYHEAMSIEALGGSSARITDQAAVTEMQSGSAVKPLAQLEALPPAGPYKPSARDIQTALKNAGYYMGEIDGKAGPLTKKAIKDFQKANNLEVDGKVGPKTWGALGAYLNPRAVPAGKKR